MTGSLLSRALLVGAGVLAVAVTVVHPDRAPAADSASSPIARGGLYAVVAALAFGVTTPLIQKLGRDAGAFPTACLLYAGAALAVAVALFDDRELS